MKKRNLKNLSLNKTSVSNLNGGTEGIDTNPTITGPSVTILNSNDCSDWCSELNTVCGHHTCNQTCNYETCGIDCETIHKPF